MNNLVEGKIYLPKEELDQIGEVYQVAFAGSPWFEVSECASSDIENRCEGGFSTQKVGEFCARCAKVTKEEAYPLTELRESLSTRLRYPEARLYREHDGKGNLLLAALFWEDTPKEIAAKKYVDVPSMQDWLKANLPDEPMVWLDEIFASRDLRPTGNLWNFPKLVSDVFVNSGCARLAFRTIN